MFVLTGWIPIVFFPRVKPDICILIYLLSSLLSTRRISLTRSTMRAAFNKGLMRDSCESFKHFTAKSRHGRRKLFYSSIKISQHFEKLSEKLHGNMKDTEKCARKENDVAKIIKTNSPKRLQTKLQIQQSFVVFLNTFERK